MKTPTHPSIASVTVDDKEEAAEKKAGLKLQSLRIEVAANGYVMYEELQPVKAKGKGAEVTMSYHEPDKKVFANAKALLAYIKQELQAHEGDGPSAKDAEGDD